MGIDSWQKNAATLRGVARRAANPELKLALLRLSERYDDQAATLRAQRIKAQGNPWAYPLKVRNGAIPRSIT